jgi:predicted HTH transcriptional regulator
MVEIFDDRIEITNPGEPLVDTERFVDTPPKLRNEGLASLMRRFRICEERGSGIDKLFFKWSCSNCARRSSRPPRGSRGRSCWHTSQCLR